MICVVRGGRLFNNVNKDVNLFKMGVSDMPFRAKPHIDIVHGGAPWAHGNVLIWRIGV